MHRFKKKKKRSLNRLKNNKFNHLIKKNLSTSKSFLSLTWIPFKCPTVTHFVYKVIVMLWAQDLEHHNTISLTECMYMKMPNIACRASEPMLWLSFIFEFYSPVLSYGNPNFTITQQEFFFLTSNMYTEFACIVYVYIYIH